MSEIREKIGRRIIEKYGSRNVLVNYMLIAGNIARAQEKLNISELELAKLCNISVSTLNKYLRGNTSMKVKTLTLIADNLQTTLENLCKPHIKDRPNV